MKIHCPHECPYYHDGPVMSLCDLYGDKLEYSQYKRPLRCDHCRDTETHEINYELQELDFNHE